VPPEAEPPPGATVPAVPALAATEPPVAWPPPADEIPPDLEPPVVGTVPPELKRPPVDTDPPVPGLPPPLLFPPAVLLVPCEQATQATSRMTGKNDRDGRFDMGSNSFTGRRSRFAT